MPKDEDWNPSTDFAAWWGEYVEGSGLGISPVSRGSLFSGGTGLRTGRENLFDSEPVAPDDSPPEAA